MALEVEVYQKCARELAGANGWPFADVAAEVARRVEGGEPLARYINQSDQIHPSRAGYRVCAEVLAETIHRFGLAEATVSSS